MARLLLLSIVLAHLSMLVLSQPPAPSPAPSEGGVVIPASPGIRRIARHRSDKSEAAGGDVILGGFLVAIIAVVLCYIRVTRPNQTQDA
ncbi:transcription factor DYSFUNCTIONAL TAPETUM [Salix suchowensis]|nr:transcription factor DYSFUNCTIONAL TAPETUM [Salix suchowensis]